MSLPRWLKTRDVAMLVIDHPREAAERRFLSAVDLSRRIPMK
jgi:hypothetical protein